jgi:hypothetical protein
MDDVAEVGKIQGSVAERCSAALLVMYHCWAAPVRIEQIEAEGLINSALLLNNCGNWG